MTKKIEKYYLLPDEEEPYRTCKSKNFIPKLSVDACVAVLSKLMATIVLVVVDGFLKVSPEGCKFNFSETIAAANFDFDSSLLSIAS
ncbi:hypothetical protein COLO4_18992 [Corchorus olitorius]|uniref:Uncharacterized protein n=1 Tax=Corchorus olitorius TaxID=93759 RepID=A0A1R3J769_9ROSI|nr:hypothetical protein COLO4_18992 [Corchorus olitorius]